MVSSGSPRVGFLGLGTMGQPMAANLLKAGVNLTVWNRTPGKTQELEKLGAKIGKGPAQVAHDVDIVISMVSQPADVEELVTRPDGIADGLKPGTIHIDMSTVTPSTSRKVAGVIASKQGEFLDAPVVGSKGPAIKGELVIVVGGLPQTVEKSREVLSAMGKAVVHAGDVGMGSTLKLSTNLMLAHLMVGFSEGILMLERSGADVPKWLEVLQHSTFPTPWYTTKGMTVIKRKFEQHFALKHMHKDLRLMGEHAKDVETILPVTKAIEQCFAEAEAEGHGELDYSAIFKYLEGLRP